MQPVAVNFWQRLFGDRETQNHPRLGRSRGWFMIYQPQSSFDYRALRTVPSAALPDEFAMIRPVSVL